MFEPPCSQSGQTFANPLLMKMVSRISFATTVPVSPNSVGMFSGMFRTCMGDKDARASVVHVQFKEQCAVYKGNKSLMLALELKVGFEPGINKVGPAYALAYHGPCLFPTLRQRRTRVTPLSEGLCRLCRLSPFPCSKKQKPQHLGFPRGPPPWY